MWKYALVAILSVTVCLVAVIEHEKALRQQEAPTIFSHKVISNDIERVLVKTGTERGVYVNLRGESEPREFLFSEAELQMLIKRLRGSDVPIQVQMNCGGNFWLGAGLDLILIIVVIGSLMKGILALIAGTAEHHVHKGELSIAPDTL
jgi:hypothetical protein